jgi:hypothetical protein
MDQCRGIGKEDSSATQKRREAMIRDTIIRRIVQLDMAGNPLVEDDIRSAEELLYLAAIEEFGSWDTAIEYAGVSVRDALLSRELSPERVKHRLRRLCTTGYDLGATVNRNRDKSLYLAALKHFGTWRKALASAGIDLKNVANRKPKHLTRETMLLWIRGRHETGKTLMYRDACLENRDYALAIRREFGSWIRAVREALGKPPPDERS